MISMGALSLSMLFVEDLEPIFFALIMALLVLRMVIATIRASPICSPIYITVTVDSSSVVEQRMAFAVASVRLLNPITNSPLILDLLKVLHATLKIHLNTSKWVLSLISKVQLSGKQLETACNTPGAICSTDGGVTGVCLDAVSAAGRRTRSLRERDTRYQLALNYCGGGGKQVCEINGKFECVDTFNSLEYCGGCPGSKVLSRKRGLVGEWTDCMNLEGADDVACVAGGCVINTCVDGFMLFDNTCIRI
ncbi:hypothetical protein BT69DRAFT_1320894 [Atractiella rhizophila]|nr:hypothetical protein BT69DRAFT_1320894 [Atractiella rhizophila]